MSLSARFTLPSVERRDKPVLDQEVGGAPSQVRFLLCCKAQRGMTRRQVYDTQGVRDEEANPDDPSTKLQIQKHEHGIKRG